jgi:hypothetical protein
VTFPDYDSLVAESHPSVPGAKVREAMIRRGAELERERIVGLLNSDSRFVGARRLLLELIEATDDAG